jgi:hypothetical protein
MITSRRIWAIVTVVLIVAAALAVRHGIQSQKKAVAPAEAATNVPVAKMVPVTGFAPEVTYESLAEDIRNMKPATPGYTLKPGLSNVANLKVFAGALGTDEKEMIRKNGFVVTPTDDTQMYYIYENNEYQRPQRYPAFITTDSMLHTYHVFYDYSLRKVESDALSDAAIELTDIMLATSEKDYGAAKDPAVKDAARRNIAYFAVARFLLKGVPPPASVNTMAAADLGRIEAHSGRDQSAIIGVKMDFSQFVPRGHYTRSEKLKKYFKAMMWYGLAPLPVPDKRFGPGPTLQALLMVRNLRNSTSGGKSAMDLWGKIYEPTAFYVGTADDYTVYQYSKIMDKVYGTSFNIDELSKPAKLKSFTDEVNKLPGPRIANVVADPGLPAGRQFRFMGQRFIADSRIMQELTGEDRTMPVNLDVFAAMGSDRALNLLKKHYETDRVPWYATQMAKMREEMSDTSSKTWQSNLYYGWLWSLQSLTRPVGAGYPQFMRNDAWLDKSLFTAASSWTELRHDTILYGKQSVAECGGDEEELKLPKGYVEPNPEFWTKLMWLNRYTEAGLSGRGILSAELKDKFTTLGDLIEFCRKISIKELTNQKVTDEEYQQISTYGAELEALTTSFADADILSDTDKDMAIVADVHTSFGSVLEEGTGRAGAIYVVVPIEGKLYLTRGAVYTQYEFTHPSSDRLTDEQWQKMLQSGKTPALADWVKSFLIKSNRKPNPGLQEFTGGC